MRGNTVRLLAAKELRDALRNRWFIAYGVSLVTLSLALATFVLASAAYGPATGFGRTAAGIINVMLLLVPLMGLTLGALSLAGERERGSLDFWLSQPLETIEVYLGKALGLGLALAAVVSAGFGTSGLLLGIAGSTRSPFTLLLLTGLTILLGWASLAIGLCVSARAARATTAVSIAVALWLVLVLVSSLGVMGTALVVRLSPLWLLATALANPVESYRIVALRLLSGSLELLGPAGLYAQDTLGPYLTVTFLGGLLLWSCLGLGFGYLVFRKETRR
jgi:Cu-processing system permease protein